MEMCKLCDLGANGPGFTWRGPIFQGGQWIFERLDRAICNEEWRLLFTEAQVKVLTRVEFSDHHPIMIALTNSSHERIPKPFWFESAWMVDNKYIDRLRGFWNKQDDFMKNLQRVESDANEWKSCSVQHVQKVKRCIMARLQGIQRGIQDKHNISGQLRLEKKLQGPGGAQNNLAPRRTHVVPEI
ncbi:uncharacterized protein LOC131628419 [Vicia villosa]|uniref:uncharacterized protein LOC131628419 n=1 Tax=Vicia villosa TaxID=3911 RepID=UPI00273C4C69|nr:uncharacterized protein LOC131628419 [Vicia villosa]